jgi:transposase
MLYAGIDYHKRYSQVHVIDERGRTCATARLANYFGTVSGFFARLAEPCRAVVEAGWNWGVMYDWLDAEDNVSTVELAHPYRVRAIAAAQVKTDSTDSHTLAQLLRVNLIPRAYVPGTETRRLREAVRQRALFGARADDGEEPRSGAARASSCTTTGGERHLRQART